MGDETDKSKVLKKSQGQEVVPKDLQDRAVGLEGLQGQSADQKAPEDQEGAEGAQTRLLTTKAPFSEEDFRDTLPGTPAA